MINLRYHVVSITAVFLALGIGLTLGSTFLDRVTVDVLKNQLDTVQIRVDETQADNDTLSGRVSALEGRDGELADELPERLLAGHLAAVPVLVVATAGTDQALVDQTIRAIGSAGATVAGTWWLTDRWLLDDPEEISDLATVLELTTDDAGRLRRNGAIRVAELFDEAALPAAVAPVPEPGGVAPTEPAAIVVPAPTEPALIALLEEAGFIDYQPLAGSGDDRVLLPGAATRYVVLSGALPDTGPQLFAGALLEEVVADGVAPVVAAQGEVSLRRGDAPASEDARRSTFVGPLREGELTRDRLSTIDDLDTAAGLAALVLALEDLSIPSVGHYGSSSSATRLLPAVPSG